VAADWHELMILQRTTQPFIARISEQLDLRSAAPLPAPIRHTRFSPHCFVSYYSFPIPSHQSINQSIEKMYSASYSPERQHLTTKKTLRLKYNNKT